MPTKIRHTKVPKKELEHLDRCLNDLSYYSESHLKIVTKKGELIPLRANRAQEILDDVIAKQKKERGYVRAVVLKARQEGITTRIGSRNFRAANLLGNLSCVVIGHKEKPTAKIFKMYERFERNLDVGMHPGKVASNRGQYLEFQNGSSISVETAGDPEAGRSQTIHRLHGSEVAFWPNAAQVYVAIASAVPDESGEIILESTANGVGNFFHVFWKQAEEGQNDFVPVFLPWFIHEEYQAAVTDEEREQIAQSEDLYERKALDEGFEFMGEMVKLTPEQLMWRRKTLANKLAGDVRKFKQEYPSTPREAFITSGDTFFDTEKLELYEYDVRPAVLRGTFVTQGEGFVLQPSEFGYARIWETPRADGLYIIGADTAKGEKIAATHIDTESDNEKGGRDFSCAQVFDLKTRTVVAQLHGRMEPPEFAKQLNWLSYYYGSRGPGGIIFPATVAVENNHESGKTTIKKLSLEHKHPALYYARTWNVRTRKVTSAIGWNTSKVTRGPMLDELSEAIRDYDLVEPGQHAIVVFDAATIGEMFTFVRGDDGKPQAQEGTHDDRVLALAIALQAAQSEGARHAQSYRPDDTTTDSATGYTDFGY